MPGDASTRGFFTYGGIETVNPGVRAVQGRTIPNRFNSRYAGAGVPSNAVSSGGHSMPNYSNDGGGEEHPAGGNPLLVWVLGVGILVGLHFLLRGMSDGPNILGINVVNALVVTIYAILGISLFKVVTAKVMIPGVSPLVAGV